MNTRNEEFENYNGLYSKVVKEEKIHFVETGGEEKPELPKGDVENIINDESILEIPLGQFEIVNPDNTEIVKEAVQC